MTVSTDDQYEDVENPGLAGLLQRQVSACGSAIAIEDGTFVLSYAGLHSKALFVAWQIQSRYPADTTPIGIIIPRSIDHVVCQVAVIYLGRACVPLDEELPDSHLENMLGHLGSTFILTSPSQQHRLPSFNRLVVDHRTVRENPGQAFRHSGKDPHHCSHVLHTSGTTGKPKAVEVLAQGIINLSFDPMDLARASQRIGHGSSVIFDASLAEIWCTLLRGATLVVIPRAAVVDPAALSDFIKTKQLDVFHLTTSLLTVTAYACPAAFSTLDTLISGGEAMNCQIVQSIFEAGPPKRLINGYGPTECTVYTLMHVVSYEDARRGDIPIGRPLGNVKTFIVCDDLRPVQPGDVGELLIAGLGVAGGYIGDVERTAESFLSLTHLDQTVSPGSGYIYRTGDLVRLDQKGVHMYIGRRDNQIKIRGRRVELEALESMLLQTGLVSAAAVIKITPKEADKGQFLLAYCIPASPSVTSATVIKSYIEHAPHLMIPRVELVDSLPLRTTGKVDRKLLAEQYHENIRLSREKGIEGCVSEDDVASQLEYIWIDVFGLPVVHLAPSDDFIAMGGTSLMAAMVIARINRTFDISLRAQLLYENTTLESLAQTVTQILNEGDDLEIQAEADVWQQDSQLAQHLKPLKGAIPNWQDASEGRVFLTGATGFVGVFLLAALLQRPDVKSVACLVRSESEASAMLRLEKTLNKYRLIADLDKIVALPGNFALPKLGLSDQQYDFYAEWASVVFHLGAKVSYVAPYSSHREENVVGTLNMLEFVNHKRPKALHYSSTIAVYGPTGYVTGAKYLPEDERPASHLAALLYDMGYSQSKFVAEALIWKAIDNGFPIAIYRPGFVLGHSKTGICNTDDFVSRLYTSCMEMGIYPTLPAQRKEFIPVDFVVDAMLHISTSPENWGHAYNLVQPDPSNAIDVNTSFDILSRISPHTIRAVPYPDWVAALLSTQAADDPLHPLTPMLKEQVLDGKTRWEVYEDMPAFGRENLRRALRDVPGILDCEPMEVIFRRSLQSWMRAHRLDE